jgi:TRAP-type C4-dicarboxylate transport system substrate-binding protein
MKRIAAFFLTTFLAATHAHAADPMLLKFAFTAPPTSWVNTMGADPWSKAVMADAESTLDIKIFYGTALGTAANIYDRTVNGVVEISFGTFGDLTGQFQKVNVVSLPFETKDCTEGALALWSLYKNGALADEMGAVRPLALFTFPGIVLTSKKSIRNAADLAGVKVAAGGRLVAQGLQVLGAVPVTLVPTELYQALQRDIVNGVTISWAGVSIFKLDEITKYSLDMPLGVVPGYFFMNKDAYARLPAAARNAIDVHAGDKLNMQLSKACFEAGNANRPNLLARGHTISELEPAEAERWKARMAQITDEWVKATPGGGEVLAAYKAEVKKIRAMK